MERIERVMAGLVKVAKTRSTKERRKSLNLEPRRGMPVVERFYKKKLNLFFVEADSMKLGHYLMDM